MKLAKLLLICLIVGVIGVLVYVVPSNQTDVAQSNELQRERGTADRGDDPTYSEEVKQLTALTRKQSETASQKEKEFDKKIRELEQKIQDAKRATQLSGNDDQRLKQLEQQVSTIGSSLEQSLAPLKDTLSKITSEQARSASRQSGASHLKNHVRIMPFGQTTTAVGLPQGTNPIFYNPASVTSNKAAIEKKPPIPVYTLHDAAILSNSRSVTPIIGRVPNGGNVQDPFRFRIVTGGDNIMANGHRVPGVKDAIWSGYAIGVREESCVRGYIDTVTFVFVDGTISTTPANGSKATRVSQSTRVTEGLGYLADSGGNQCITGLLVNNASAYLRDRSGAAFAEGLAAAYASAQTTVDRTGNGGLSAYVSGDTIKFGVGRGVSKSAAEVATYLRQRQENAFDVVYFPSDQNLQIMLEKQIEIDYDPNGRKVNYHYAKRGNHEKSPIHLD